jgi:plastocyanin domain-containing protein
MDNAEIIVTLGGILAAAWVVWFFFLGERRQVQAAAAGAAQRVRVVVKGGYDPDVIVAEPGRPLKIDFYRDETESCSERVVFGDFGVSRSLPPFKTTTVEIDPKEPGEFVFTCGMNMLRGKLIVREPKEVG